MSAAIVLLCCVFSSAFCASLVSENSHAHQSMGISPNGNFAIAKVDERSSDSSRDASISSRPVAYDSPGVPADLLETARVSKIMREEKMGAPPKEEDSKTQPEKTVANAIGYCFNLLIIIVFAYVYKTKVVDIYPRYEGAPPQTDKHDFKKGMCACWSSLHLCCHATFCTQTRAAHTWAVTGVASFWTALLAFVCCPCFMPCIGGCLWRAQLREKFGIEKDIVKDFFMWCCCTPCAVGQEALQLDEATGKAVQCCCNLVDASPAESTPANNELAEPLLNNATSSSDPAPANNDTANNDTANPQGNEAREEEPSP